jgi:hypothetical protein
MVVAGYSLPKTAKAPIPPDDIATRASCIEKLYCHDDQVGPFARMEFDGKVPVSSISSPNPPGTLNAIEQRFQPMSLMVPLYHKIRIPYAVVRRDVVELEVVIIQSGSTVRFEWDITLITIDQLKKDYVKDQSLGNLKVDLLTMMMPRFIWRAVATLNGVVMAEFLFDATDVTDHSSCFHVVNRNSSFENSLKNLVKIHNANHQLEALPVWRVLRHYS